MTEKESWIEFKKTSNSSNTKSNINDWNILIIFINSCEV